MTHQARFVTEPTVVLLGEMQIRPEGVAGMVDWVRSRAPACVPEECVPAGGPFGASNQMVALFPHNLHEGDRPLTDNELLIELAGRSCYLSYGLKAGRKSNAEYIAHTQQGDVPHASLLYHAKLSFFFAGISRRVSHELIRNYVGADRTEEGAPSQQSTRYVENPGFYVIPPRYLDDGQLGQRAAFEELCEQNFHEYRRLIRNEIEQYTLLHGSPPKGIDYKRILEAASGALVHSIETSFVWTTNVAAIAKLLRERHHEAADLEFYRFAGQLKRVVMAHCPNAFPQPHMREGL